MQFNAAGLHLVQFYEQGPGGGPALEAYKDAAGHWTIGWGHKVKDDEHDLLVARITREKAKQLLIADLKWAQQAVRRALRAPINPNMFSALVAFTYNLGEGALQRSTLLRLVNAGEYQRAAGEFEQWVKVRQNGKLVKAEGLVRRRACEQFLFTAPMVQLTRADVEEACAGEEQA